MTQSTTASTLPSPSSAPRSAPRPRSSPPTRDPLPARDEEPDPRRHGVHEVRPKPRTGPGWKFRRRSRDRRSVCRDRVSHRRDVARGHRRSDAAPARHRRAFVDSPQRAVTTALRRPAPTRRRRPTGAIREVANETATRRDRRVARRDRPPPTRACRSSRRDRVAEVGACTKRQSKLNSKRDACSQSRARPRDCTTRSTIEARRVARARVRDLRRVRGDAHSTTPADDVARRAGRAQRPSRNRGDARRDRHRSAAAIRSKRRAVPDDARGRESFGRSRRRPSSTPRRTIVNAAERRVAPQPRARLAPRDPTAEPRSAGTGIRRTPEPEIAIEADVAEPEPASRDRR